MSTVNERVPLKDELAFELSTFFARHQYCVAVCRLNGPGTAALPVWPTLRLVEVESNVPSDVEHELSAQTSKTTLPKSSVSSSSKDAESVGVSELMKTPPVGATSVAAFGAAFGVRFVAAWAPYVAAVFPARSVTAVPEYATVTGVEVAHGVVERQADGRAAHDRDAVNGVAAAVHDDGEVGGRRRTGERLAVADVERRAVDGARRDGGGDRVDDDVLLAAEARGAADRRERERRVVARAVLDRPAVQRERAGRRVVEVGGVVARLHRVVEGQGRRAGARGVVRGARRRRVERQLRRAGDEHGVAEGQLDVDHVCGLVRAVGVARGHRASSAARSCR